MPEEAVVVVVVEVFEALISNYEQFSFLLRVRLIYLSFLLVLSGALKHGVQDVQESQTDRFHAQINKHCHESSSRHRIAIFKASENEFTNMFSFVSTNHTSNQRTTSRSKLK